jgi:hypothetical protein
MLSIYSIWLLIIKCGTDLGDFDGINKSRNFPVRSIILCKQEKKATRSMKFIGSNWIQ